MIDEEEVRFHGSLYIYGSSPCCHASIQIVLEDAFADAAVIAQSVGWDCSLSSELWVF